MSACALIRARTAELHARVESRTGFDDGTLSPVAVLALLAGLADLSEQAGTAADRLATADHDLPALLRELDWPVRRLRAARYRDDLVLLAEQVGTPVPVAEPAPAITDPTELLGWLYVLEGASLGSVLIQRRLVEQAWAADVTLTSFRGYGEDTGRRWRIFRAAADEWAVRGTGRDEAMALAATAAFGRIDRRVTATLAAGESAVDGSAA